jgi:hypothetical protein
MATQWVLDKVSDALAPTVSNAVASAGSFAGGAVNAVGASINSVGESINGTVRRYGDGVKDYGNGLLDWTKADGIRAATASNPLGLSAGTTGGKRQVTSGSFYKAPAANPSKTLMTTSKTAAPQKKVAAGTASKSTPVKKATTTGTTTKKAPAQPLKPVQRSAKTVHPNPGAIPSKKVATNGAAKAPASVAKKPTPVKAGAKPAPTAKKTSAPKPNYTAASNPLGLSF